MNRAGFTFGAGTIVAAALALAACGRSRTGVEVVFHTGSLQYDELRLRVTDANETPVDPAGNGRFVAPFSPGDQSVIVYLADGLDGIAVHCDAEARQAGAVIATGAGDVTVKRDEIERVEIVMAGGAAGTGGATGTGGTTGTAGTTGMGGTSPPPGRANGETCSIGAECVSTHCSDGVCCEEECQHACRSCALPDTKGLCRPVAAGTPDPRAMCNDKGAATCMTNGLCDVAGDCAVYPAGTICQPASCADMDMSSVPERACDGMGHCQGPDKKMKCEGGSRCAAGVCS